VEAASAFGWERYVGRCGVILSMKGFGASAPADRLMAHFGFTAERVAEVVRRLRNP
jgi:transketolase